MKSSEKSPIWLISLILVAVSGAAIVHADSSAGKIPNGYMEGRKEAKYGTYNSTIQPAGRSYQERVLKLTNQAYGFAKMANKGVVMQSGTEFLLESAIIRLHLDISNAPASSLTDFERKSLLFESARAFTIIRLQSERLYENMIRFIDKKIPGPNGQQIRSEINDSTESLYEANYRMDQDLTVEERAVRFQKAVTDFAAKGGSLSEIKKLDKTLSAEMEDYTRVEYVVRENGEIWVTPGKAGHVLLANGEPVKAAGQMIFVKNKAGTITLLVISNSSGNYKPDILSVSQLGTRLAEELSIAPELIVVTKGEPMSAQGVKVTMKGNGVDPEEISKVVKLLETRSAEILSSKASTGLAKCGAVFDAAS